MTWWAHLSWSHAMIIALLILIAFGSLLMILLIPRESEHKAYFRPWPVVDYSAQYRRKVAWLGERYLLSRPINRRPA